MALVASSITSLYSCTRARIKGSRRPYWLYQGKYFSSGAPTYTASCLIGHMPTLKPVTVERNGIVCLALTSLISGPGNPERSPPFFMYCPRKSEVHRLGGKGKWDKKVVASAWDQLSSMCPMPKIMPVFCFNNYISKAFISNPVFLKLCEVKDYFNFFQFIG